LPLEKNHEDKYNAIPRESEEQHATLEGIASSDQRTIPVPRGKWGKWTIVFSAQMAIIVALMVLIILFYILSTTHICPERNVYPSFDLTVSSTPEGYEIEFTVVSEAHSLDSYEVDILKDGERWGGFPARIEHGSLGQGPAGEYLNFTDPTLDGNLTTYDWFTLENLESGAEYEFILLWAECDRKLATEVLSVP